MYEEENVYLKIVYGEKKMEMKIKINIIHNNK